MIRLQFDSVWKLLRLAVSLLLFLGSICITLMFIVGFNLKVWCSCLSDMFLWIIYCISFYVPKPWSLLCVTWWSISNLYNIGLVGECYIEIGIGYYQEWWNITGKLPPCIALCWNLVAIIPSKVEAMRPHVRHSRCYFGNFLTLDGFLALTSNIICTETIYQNTNGEFFFILQYHRNTAK